MLYRPLRTQAEELTFIYGEVFNSNSSTTEAHAEVSLDWAPPGLPGYLTGQYLLSLPADHQPVQGSEGALRRKKQLEKQFPLHDLEQRQASSRTGGRGRGEF